MNSIAGSHADAEQTLAAAAADVEPMFCIMGPTASGKTDIAQALCDRFPFEIISVDAALVYRGLDVGTAKPSVEQRRQYPHHLVDIIDPASAYSAAEFVRDLYRLRSEIQARQRWPLLVGGTMFYFNAIESGLRTHPGADPTLRGEISARGEAEGWAHLHQELSRLDLQRARAINPNDRQRIQRALEICMLSGRNVAPRNPAASGPSLIKLALAAPDRHWLHQRIEARFQHMLAHGLLEEVKCLLNQQLPDDNVALRTVGYRQAIEYLSGKVSYNDFVLKAVAATRQLAKRQLTWLRNQAGVTWIDCTSGDLIGQLEVYIANKKLFKPGAR